MRRGTISIVEVNPNTSCVLKTWECPSLCRGVPSWAPRVRRQGARGAPQRDAPTISPPKQFGSEEKPDAELDVTRLVEIGVASRDTENTQIIEIQAW